MGVEYAPFSLDHLLLFTRFGNICVAIFVFLSAYGITKGLKAQGEISLSKQYHQATRRAGVLLANFAVMFISVNALWFYKFNYNGLYGMNKQGMIYLFLDMFGLAELFDTPTLNATWWYMELAIILIFMVPFIYGAAKKVGNILLIPAVLFSAVFVMDPDVLRYYFVIFFGVCAANGNWLDKALNTNLAWIWKALLGVCVFVLCVLIRQNYVVYTYFAYLVDAPIALLMTWFGCEIFGRVSWIKKGIAFLGKHSMNIYFVHTFFYMAIYQKFIYSFRYAALILLALILVSLLYSIVLEGIKKWLGFYKLMRKLAQ